jgi:hypothetical protein
LTQETRAFLYAEENVLCAEENGLKGNQPRLAIRVQRNQLFAPRPPTRPQLVSHVETSTGRRGALLYKRIFALTALVATSGRRTSGEGGNPSRILMLVVIESQNDVCGHCITLCKNMCGAAGIDFSERCWR